VSSRVQVRVGDGVVGVRDGVSGGEERVVCLWSRHGGGNGQRCGKKSEKSEELHLIVSGFWWDSK
jgi:hypothetical protein